MAATGLELRSLVTEQGKLELSLASVTVPEPGPGEIVIQIDATPINPSDQWLLLGPADLATGVVGERDGQPTVTYDIPERGMMAMTARIGQSMPVGNESAGTVIAAGPDVQHLLGRVVAASGGAMYATHRLLKASNVLLLDEGTDPRDGASAFVNPLTTLGMLGTMRAEGHNAIVHTAAASNLGQMLVRLCRADGVPLVCIVRSDEQAAILRDLGAEHVVDSGKDGFQSALTDAVAATGATLAFDAIGGGDLANRILVAMEAAIARRGGAYSRYGSEVHKQVYLYGGLDRRPTTIDRSVGMAWGVGGWLLTPFLMKQGPGEVAKLWDRVRRELPSTFASTYSATISLQEALKPDIVAAYAKKATGEKYLITPASGAIS